MTRVIIALIAFVALWQPTASTAQCPVNSGWWVYENPSHTIKLKFHVKPEGTQVDSLEFSLHSVCSVSGTRSFTSAGRPITCEPWGFTWPMACNVSSWTDGFNLAVTFVDEQHSAVTLDIVTWFDGCAVCRALETSGVVGTAISTWGGIKALYDSQ